MEIFNTKIPITKAFCKFVQNYKMQRLVFIIFLSFFLVTSCAKQKPKGVLSENKMADLLSEVSMIDAYINTLPIDSGRRVLPVLYDNLFKEFEIDSNQYKINQDYYFGNPKLTEKIYVEVNKKLVDLERAYNQEDSIRNVVVHDSLRRVTKIQNLDRERRSLAINYQKDTTKYTYVSDGLSFLRKAELQLNAYGIQIPAITTPVVQPVSVEEQAPIADSVSTLDKDQVPLEPVKPAIVKKELPNQPKAKKIQIQEQLQK